MVKKHLFSERVPGKQKYTCGIKEEEGPVHGNMKASFVAASSRPVHLPLQGLEALGVYVPEHTSRATAITINPLQSAPPSNKRYCVHQEAKEGLKIHHKAAFPA